MSHELVISNLQAEIAGVTVVDGLNLTVSSGEVHVLMGPNGAGKSSLANVIMGDPRYLVTGGSIKLDGTELVDCPVAERAAAGLYLGMQYPVEVTGVDVFDMLAATSGSYRREDVEARAMRLRLPDELLTRDLNVDLSGGEQKRLEMLQLSVLQPSFAVLDEIDSGLDVDALGLVAGSINELVIDGLGVIAITHYSRLADQIAPDFVHVLSGGVIERSGGLELVAELEKSGYEGP